MSYGFDAGSALGGYSRFHYRRRVFKLPVDNSQAQLRAEHKLKRHISQIEQQAT